MPQTAPIFRLSRRFLLVSALFLASSCDSPERHALRQLSREGIQPSGRALVEAITLDEVQHVEWLLDVKVHTEQRDAMGHTPLRIAIEQDHPSTALMLLESGANPNARSPDGIDILGIALEKNFPEVVENLIERGAKPDGAMPSGEMILPWAIRNARLASVRAMFSHGADPHLTDRNGNPLLHIAIAAGHKDLVKALIEHGADPGATDPEGNSTIALALKNKWTGILPTLAAAGADTNLPSAATGKTLLEQAIEDRDTKIIPLLMRIGADPVRLPTTPGGVTPLEAAIAAGHPETLEAVLRPGEMLGGPSGSRLYGSPTARTISNWPQCFSTRGRTHAATVPTGFCSPRRRPFHEKSPGSNSSSTTATTAGNPSTTLPVGATT